MYIYIYVYISKYMFSVTCMFLSCVIQSFMFIDGPVMPSTGGLWYLSGICSDMHAFHSITLHSLDRKAWCSHSSS